jgi:hypothetical protein
MQKIFFNEERNTEKTLDKVLKIKQSLSFDQMFKSLNPILYEPKQNFKIIAL